MINDLKTPTKMPILDLFRKDYLREKKNGSPQTGNVMDRKQHILSLAFCRVFISLLVLYLVTGLSACSQTQTQVTAVVLRIVDGETLIVSLTGAEKNPDKQNACDCGQNRPEQNPTETVKLLGLETLPNWPNKKAQAEARKSGQSIRVITTQGQDALRFVQSLVKAGERVIVELDRQKRDQYCRLLGYVYLPSGKMLNEEVLRAGYASLVLNAPNVRCQERLSKAYAEAREKRRGFWNSLSNGSGPLEKRSQP